MTGNFNIRDNSWNLLFSHHSSYNDILIDFTDFLNLYISKPTNQVSTKYSDNQNDSNSAIDLTSL